MNYKQIDIAVIKSPVRNVQGLFYFKVLRNALNALSCSTLAFR